MSVYLLQIPNYLNWLCNYEDFPNDLQRAELISEVVWVQDGVSLTLDGSQDDAGVVVGDDVGITILGFIHLQVGVLPGELLARINGLVVEKGEGRKAEHGETKLKEQKQ